MKVKAVHHGSERSECNPIVADGRECPYQNDRRMALANIKSRRGFRLPSRRFNLSAKRYAMSSPGMTCLAKKPAQIGQKSRTPSHVRFRSRYRRLWRYTSHFDGLHVISGKLRCISVITFLRAARNGEGRPLLKRLKPGEAAAVLRCLLEAHPDLADEAEGFARSVLHQLKYQDVAAEIEDEIRQLDYEDLNARAGNHEWGYVEPSEAAWEILEQTVQPFLDEMSPANELGEPGLSIGSCQ